MFNSKLVPVRRSAPVYSVIRAIFASFFVLAGTAYADAPSIDDQLRPVQMDFDAHNGAVRLVFIVGPTCPGCLVRLDEMAKRIRPLLDDPRMFVQIISTPTVEATVRDVAKAKQLIGHPRVRHYWDGEKAFGNSYRLILGLEDYAWDVWMLFGPDARWPAGEPPEPDAWNHHLGTEDPAHFYAPNELLKRASESLDRLAR